MIRAYVGDYMEPTTINEQEMLNVTLYPNPANDCINVYIKDNKLSEKIFFSVFDIYGKNILNLPIESELTPISIAHLSNGIYIARIVYNNMKLNH